MEGCEVFAYIPIEGLDGCLFCLNCYRCKGNEDFVRSDVPGLKVVPAHIEVLDHFPIYTNGYKAFALVQWEIVVTATIVIIVIVCCCHDCFLLGLTQRKPHGDI